MELMRCPSGHWWEYHSLSPQFTSDPHIPNLTTFCCHMEHPMWTVLGEMKLWAPEVKAAFILGGSEAAEVAYQMSQPVTVERPSALTWSDYRSRCVIKDLE